MFIGMSFEGVSEPKPVPAGRYDVTLADAKHVAEKSYIRVSAGIDIEPTAPNITIFVSLPKPDDDEGKVMFKKLLLKRFLTQFKIPTNGDGFNLEDIAGSTANVQVNMKEPDDKGVVYNEIQLDKLSNEDNTSGRTSNVGKKKA